MKTPRKRFGCLVAAIAILITPSFAGAESVVPPGNSAAAQYTEAFPTAGGQKRTGNAQRGKGLSPAKTLGAHNVRRLEAQGGLGHEAAEVAAATAPSPAPQASQPPPASHAGASANGDNRAGGSGGAGAAPSQQSVNQAGGRSTARVDDAGGSSGFGEVLGQATGSSSPGGGAGILLPLVVIGTIVGSAAIVWQRKRRAG